MKRKRHTPEQIIRKLRTAEQLLTKDRPWPTSSGLWRCPHRRTTADSNSTAA